MSGGMGELMVDYPKNFDYNMVHWLLEQDLEHYRLEYRIQRAIIILNWLNDQISSSEMELRIRDCMKLQKRLLKVG